MLKIKKNVIIGFLAIAVFMLTGYLHVFAKENVKQNNRSARETLSAIDKYQDEYFMIVKRNNLLLMYEDNKKLNEDRKELKDLYKKVTKQITDKTYLKKYKDIEKRYAKCHDTTTVGINAFMDKNYIEINDLFNEVYEKAKSDMSDEDIQKLDRSQEEWAQDVEDYHKKYESMVFGTIGTMAYYTYQIDMLNFRTLLLMLYL